MTRFTSQQIEQMLASPAREEKPCGLSEEQLKKNEDQIISRIHAHNQHRRAGWLAAAASILLIIVAGITIENLPHRFSQNTDDDTFHALYDADECSSYEELEEQETLIECDTFLELV